jgi:hypothetical protein
MTTPSDPVVVVWLWVLPDARTSMHARRWACAALLVAVIAAIAAVTT